MRLALRLARRGYGTTSPNPMVGAVLVQGDRVIGKGWHRRAGEPHAEIEAIQDARKQHLSLKGATLFVTLEPCCTHGRTPPCTDAIISAGIGRVIIGATDSNPSHRGRGLKILRQAGMEVLAGPLESECTALNAAFNHWIVHKTPFVTVKAAMTLDGKIATATGDSKWITGEKARAYGLRLRFGADAILTGINTVLADNPRLTCRPRHKELRRIILDAEARTPLHSKLVSDEQAHLTSIVVGPSAPRSRVAALKERVNVISAPLRPRRSRGKSARQEINLVWLLRQLGSENVTSLLVEGGGEVNASFLMDGLAHRVAFFYASKVLGGHLARRAVAGEGAAGWNEIISLKNLNWTSKGQDLLLEAEVVSPDRAR